MSKKLRPIYEEFNEKYNPYGFASVMDKYSDAQDKYIDTLEKQIEELKAFVIKELQESSLGEGYEYNIDRLIKELKP